MSNFVALCVEYGLTRAIDLVQLELVAILVLQDAITCVEWRYTYASSMFENVIRQRIQKHRPGPGTAEVLECDSEDACMTSTDLELPLLVLPGSPNHLRVCRCSGYTTPDPGLNSYRTSAMHTTSNPLLPFLFLSWMSIEANHSLPYPYRSKTCAVYAHARVSHPPFILSLLVIPPLCLVASDLAAPHGKNPTQPNSPVHITLRIVSSVLNIGSNTDFTISGTNHPLRSSTHLSSLIRHPRSSPPYLPSHHLMIPALQA